MRLAGLPFIHEHIFDASAAPRGQLPYVVDDGETIGDSEIIIARLERKYALAIDAGLSAAQRDQNRWRLIPAGQKAASAWCTKKAANFPKSSFPPSTMPSR
jgi:glutathione S-transferase